MEQKLYNFFSSQTMPEDCVRHMERSIGNRTASTRPTVIPLRRILTTAAILALFCICTLGVCANNYGQGSKQLPSESAHHSVRNAYRLLFGLETRSREEQDAQEAQDRAWEKRRNQARKTPGPLAEVREGRLYFIALNEDIDITDQCSPDEVFLYTYTDGKGFIHYIGIGGTPEHWGCSEVMFDTQNPDSPSNGWSGGGGSGHWNNKTDEPYGWYVQFKKQTGHPYPL